MRAYVTGALGSVGVVLCERLRELGHEVFESDLILGTDIRDSIKVGAELRIARPDVIFHLAGAKHAGSGELDPYETADINIGGTVNVLDLAPAGCLVVLASTCKAADPETAYGASKLIAERMVLNAGHTVARFYNVRESSGNVFELWNTVPADKPVPVTRCRRYFISMDSAVRLLLACIDLPPGRYTVDPGEPLSMWDVACALGRSAKPIVRRRGDRLEEPRVADSEWLMSVGDGIQAIVNFHDKGVRRAERPEGAGRVCGPA